MESIKEILEKEQFAEDDRKVILSSNRAKILFLACAAMRTTPKDIKNSISFENWFEKANAGAISRAELKIIELQEKGGPCPICKNEFRKHEIKYKEIILTYVWQPSCQCYPRCYYCNRFMFSEVLNGEKHCRYCGAISCRSYKEETRKTSGGKREKTGKVIACEGKLELMGVHKGYTVYKCDTCDYQLKKVLVV